MNSKATKASRGRPKTLDRDHILDVATQAYWKEGVGAVSLNELCKKAKVSSQARNNPPSSLNISCLLVP